jgi:hypothetical protein
MKFNEIVGNVTTAALVVCLRAVTLSILWGWFVVPLGMPRVGAAHALGLVTLLGYALNRIESAKPDGMPFARRATLNALDSVVALACGAGLYYGGVAP